MVSGITDMEKIMKKNANGFIKKLSLFVLSFTLSCSVFAGCNPSEDSKYVSENDAAYVWCAPDTVSIMQDISVAEQCAFWGEEWLDDSNKIECEGIKGDTEAVQVMLTAKKDVASFNLVAGDLTRENGSEKIDTSNIEILAERYIETKKSSAKSNTASEFLGWYPDALVPMAAYKAKRENKIAKGNNQGIWVNIDIPTDAVSGTYKGIFTLDIDGDKLDLPVSVKVYDVTMPSEIHAKTAFDIWYEEIENGEDLLDENGNEIDWPQIYYDFAVSKRINPQTTYYMRSVVFSEKSLDRFVNEIVGIARNEKLTLFRMPYKGVNDPTYGLVVDYDLIFGILKAMAEKNIELVEQGEEIDLFKKAFFYFNSIIDEPDSQSFNRVRYCDKAVTRAKNEIAPFLDDYPQLKESLLAIPHVVTTPVDYLEYEDGGGVQTWATQAQQYKSSALGGIAERKQSTDKYPFGEGFWIYLTMESNNPYPSLQLDDNLLSPRTMFWMNQCYGIDAMLYWCMCYYSKTIPQGVSGKKVERDIWNDPNSYVNVNGDAYVLYPGTKYGLTTPLSTLRLESLRQGSEDYEYIYLLKNAIEKYNEDNGSDYDISKVMAGFYNDVFVPGTTLPRTNVKQFASARSQLLYLLDAVTNGKPDATELLSKYQSFTA